MLLLLLLAVDAEPGVKIQARGPWRHAHSNGHKGIVLRDGMDMTALLPHALFSRALETTAAIATTELAEDLKVKGIDWKKRMAVMILAGKRPTGTHVEIKSAEERKGVLVVKWKLHEPKGKPMGTEHPSECVLLPAFKGKVEFDPPLPKE